MKLTLVEPGCEPPPSRSRYERFTGRLLPPLLGVLAFAPACATQSPATVTAADAQTQQQLTIDVGAVKAAATQQDRNAAEAALAALHNDIAAARAAGRLSSSQAQSISDAATRVTEDVRALPTPSPTTVVVTVLPSTSAPEPPATPTPWQPPRKDYSNGDGHHGGH